MRDIFNDSFFRITVGFVAILALSFGITVAIDTYASGERDTAVGERQAAVVSIPSGFQAITSAEIAAMRCRGVDPNTLAGGIINAQARQVLGMPASPTTQNDWCLFVEAHAPARGEPKTYATRGGAADYASGMTAGNLACPAAQQAFQANEKNNSHYASVETNFDPAFGLCLAKFIQLVESKGHTVRLTSGTRNADDQQEIWARSCSGSGFMAANPAKGASNHNFGIAADLSFSPDLTIEEREAYAKAVGGISFTVLLRTGKDAPHIEAISSKCNSGKGPAGPAESREAALGSGAQQYSRAQMEQLCLGGNSGACAAIAYGGPVGGIPQGATQGTPQGQSLLSNLINSLFGGGSSGGGNAGGTGGSTGGAQSETGRTSQSSVYVASDKTEGASKYTVLSEDGTVLAKSDVSPEDALEKIARGDDDNDDDGDDSDSDRRAREQLVPVHVIFLLETATGTSRIAVPVTGLGDGDPYDDGEGDVFEIVAGKWRWDGEQLTFENTFAEPTDWEIGADRDGREFSREWNAGSRNDGAMGAFRSTLDGLAERVYDIVRKLFGAE